MQIGITETMDTPNYFTQLSLAFGAKQHVLSLYFL